MFDDRHGTVFLDHTAARLRAHSACGGQRTWRRPATAAVVAACLLPALGCSIAGSWRTIAVDPPGALFPVETVRFDGANTYTSTGLFHGEKRTTSGRYHFNGFKLDITEGDRLPRSYGVRLRLDGKLVLTLREGDAKITATLAKTAR